VSFIAIYYVCLRLLVVDYTAELVITQSIVDRAEWKLRWRSTMCMS
jgi:hypothetical protein